MKKIFASLMIFITVLFCFSGCNTLFENDLRITVHVTEDHPAFTPNKIDEFIGLLCEYKFPKDCKEVEVYNEASGEFLYHKEHFGDIIYKKGEVMSFSFGYSWPTFHGADIEELIKSGLVIKIIADGKVIKRQKINVEKLRNDFIKSYNRENKN